MEIVEPTNINRVRIPRINVEISPNPVTSLLSFKVDKRIYQYEVFDSKGQKILSKEAGSGLNHAMSVTDLVPGLYFLRLQGHDDVVMKSFVKM